MSASPPCENVAQAPSLRQGLPRHHLLQRWPLRPVTRQNCWPQRRLLSQPGWVWAISPWGLRGQPGDAKVAQPPKEAAPSESGADPRGWKRPQTLVRLPGAALTTRLAGAPLAGQAPTLVLAAHSGPLAAGTPKTAAPSMAGVASEPLQGAWPLSRAAAMPLGGARLAGAALAPPRADLARPPRPPESCPPHLPPHPCPRSAHLAAKPRGWPPNQQAW